MEKLKEDGTFELVNSQVTTKQQIINRAEGVVFVKVSQEEIEDLD
jgi:hypothetical protein